MRHGLVMKSNDRSILQTSTGRTTTLPLIFLGSDD